MNVAAETAALRRLPRPTGIYACAECGTVAGTHYRGCPACFKIIERYWLADWHHFLAEEQVQPETTEERLVAQIVFDEGERHLWTVLDIAMTLLTCESCGRELGGGPPDCTECASAWGVTLWSEFAAGRKGLVTKNEHALHVGRMILRHPHRQSQNIITAWSMTTPRLLTGWLPSTASAQAYMRLVKAGRVTEVEEALRQVDKEINEGLVSLTHPW